MLLDRGVDGLLVIDSVTDEALDFPLDLSQPFPEKVEKTVRRHDAMSFF